MKPNNTKPLLSLVIVLLLSFLSISLIIETIVDTKNPYSDPIIHPSETIWDTAPFITIVSWTACIFTSLFVLLNKKNK